jgi:hypothetical protein
LVESYHRAKIAIEEKLKKLSPAPKAKPKRKEAEVQDVEMLQPGVDVEVLESQPNKAARAGSSSSPSASPGVSADLANKIAAKNVEDLTKEEAEKAQEQKIKNMTKELDELYKAKVEKEKLQKLTEEAKVKEDINLTKVEAIGGRGEADSLEFGTVLSDDNFDVVEEQDDASTRGNVRLYCANSTAYGKKAKDLLGHRLADSCKGEKATVVCLQELHLSLEDCQKEADRLHARGWRLVFNEGRRREKTAGQSPGSMMAAAGIRVDYTMRDLTGYTGAADGARHGSARTAPSASLSLRASSC